MTVRREQRRAGARWVIDILYTKADGSRARYRKDAECHVVLPCEAGKYRVIPLTPGVQYVDAAADEVSANGSLQFPWTTIQNGVDAASPGGIVLVAAGTYKEHVIVANKPVKIFGTCPELVHVVGDAGTVAAFDVQEDAEGTVISGFDITSDAAGLVVWGSEDVVAEHVRIHDTAGWGAYASECCGWTSLTLRDSLVEGAVDIGVAAFGSSLRIERSTIRKTRSFPDSLLSYGVGIQPLEDYEVRPRLVLESSTISQNDGFNVYVRSGDASLHGSLLQKTRPFAAVDGSPFGSGLYGVDSTGPGDNAVWDRRPRIELHGSVIQDDVDHGVLAGGADAALLRVTIQRCGNTGAEALDDEITGERTILTILDSTLQDNERMGVLSSGSELLIDGTTIRRTHGRGVNVQDDIYSGQPGALTLTRSTIEQSVGIGLLAFNAEVVMSSAIVRATKRVVGSYGGYGVAIQVDGTLPHPLPLPDAWIGWSRIENAMETGIFLSGSHAVIDATSIGGQPGGLPVGRGLSIRSFDVGLPSDVRMTRSIVDGSLAAGIEINDSRATIETSIIRNSRPTSAGKYGDGISVASRDMRASCTVKSAAIRGNAGGGVVDFGADVTVEESCIWDNLYSFAAGALGSYKESLDLEDRNLCRCDGGSSCGQVPPMEPAPLTPLNNVPSH